MKGFTVSACLADETSQTCTENAPYFDRQFSTEIAVKKLVAC